MARERSDGPVEAAFGLRGRRIESGNDSRVYRTRDGKKVIKFYLPSLPIPLIELYARVSNTAAAVCAGWELIIPTEDRQYRLGIEVTRMEETGLSTGEFQAAGAYAICPFIPGPNFYEAINYRIFLSRIPGTFRSLLREENRPAIEAALDGLSTRFNAQLRTAGIRVSLRNVKPGTDPDRVILTDLCHSVIQLRSIL